MCKQKYTIILYGKKEKGTDFSIPFLLFMWSLLGSNQGPSDYESDALTN